jgi:hypothetical protein
MHFLLLLSYASIFSFSLMAVKFINNSTSTVTISHIIYAPEAPNGTVLPLSFKVSPGATVEQSYLIACHLNTSHTYWLLWKSIDNPVALQDLTDSSVVSVATYSLLRNIRSIYIKKNES